MDKLNSDLFAAPPPSYNDAEDVVNGFMQSAESEDVPSPEQHDYFAALVAPEPVKPKPKRRVKPKAPAKPKAAIVKKGGAAFLKQKMTALRALPPDQVAKLLVVKMTVDGEQVDPRDVAHYFTDMTGKGLHEIASISDQGAYAQRPPPMALKVATSLALSVPDGSASASADDFW